MSKIKLNKKIEDSDFDVIPDAPSNIKKDNVDVNEEEIYVIEDTQETRKLFSNKKANKVLIIISSIVAAVIIGAVIFINVV